jgi:hypothetical protein
MALVITPASGVDGGPDTTYAIRIYDPFGNAMPDLPSFNDLEIAQAVGTVGSVTFEIPGDYPREYLQKDGLITVYRAPRNRPPYLIFNKIFFLRRRFRKVSGGRRIWKITGYDPNYLLSSPSGQRGRIVAYDAESAQANQTDFADDMMKAIMRENVGSLATDTTRSLATYLDIQADSSSAPSIQKEFSNRVLVPALNEIALASTTAGTYLAWDIVCTQPPYNGTFKLEFQTFINQRGQDHRESSADRVLIGTDFGNLDDAVIDDDWTEEENYIRAGGQDNGAVRIYQSDGDDAAIAESPFNRRETFINLSNVSDTATLQDEIDSALRAGVPRPYYSGTLIPNDQTMLDVDWGFGDYLTAQDDGRAFDARADAMVVSFNDKGESIKVYLNGYNPPASDPVGSLQKQVTSARRGQERIRPLEVVNSALVPGGLTALIGLFASACPTGWTEYTAARGLAIVGVPSGGTLSGTVGTPLTNLGTRTISTVVAHVHAVGTLVNAAESSHTHGVGTYNNATEAAHTHSVDPPNTASNNAGDHDHALIFENGAGVNDGILFDATATTISDTTLTASAGSHQHDVNISSFTSAAGSSHDHALSGSSAAGSSHNHTISGSVASTGSATVDVTMPYIQLRLCQKD